MNELGGSFDVVAFMIKPSLHENAVMAISLVPTSERMLIASSNSEVLILH